MSSITSVAESPLDHRFRLQAGSTSLPATKSLHLCLRPPDAPA